MSEQLAAVPQHAELLEDLQHQIERGNGRRFTYSLQGEEERHDLAYTVREDPDYDGDWLAVVVDRPETPWDETEVIAVHQPTSQQRYAEPGIADRFMETVGSPAPRHYEGVESYEQALALFYEELFADDDDNPEHMRTADEAADLFERLDAALAAAHTNEVAFYTAKTVALSGLGRAAAARNAARRAGPQREGQTSQPVPTAPAGAPAEGHRESEEPLLQGV